MSGIYENLKKDLSLVEVEDSEKEREEMEEKKFMAHINEMTKAAKRKAEIRR